MLDNTQAVVAVALGLTSLLGAGWAFRAKVQPWWQDLRQDYIKGRDALVGRDAVVDSITGRELAPALPGIGQRMANVETAIVAIAQQQQEIADLKVTSAIHDREIARLGDGQARLEAAMVERIVTKAESAAAWRAMEAAAQAEPTEFTD